jgi:hypothetical protein
MGREKENSLSGVFFLWKKGIYAFFFAAFFAFFAGAFLATFFAAFFFAAIVVVSLVDY